MKRLLHSKNNPDRIIQKFQRHVLAASQSKKDIFIFFYIFFLNCSLSTLVDNPGTNGAPNELALILARGAGIFLEKDADISSWKGEMICDRHLKELSRQYEHVDFKHYITSKTGSIRCGFPQENHHRNANLKLSTVTFDQSKALLHSRHFLLHPGTRELFHLKKNVSIDLALCQAHHDVVRDLVSSADDPMEGQCFIDEEFSHQERKPAVSIAPVRKLFYDLAKGIMIEFQ